MKLSHLDQFIVIAEELNITKASKILRISQPGLTKNLKNLEVVLKTTLFERHRKGLTLTDTGTLLYNHACLMRHYEDSFLDEIHNIIESKIKIINIGAGYVWSVIYFPYLFKELYHNDKHIKVKLNTSNSDDLYRNLQQGKYDFILSAKPDETDLGEEFTYIKINNSFFTVFARDDHPIRQVQNLTNSTLQDYKVVVHKGFNDSHDGRQLHNISENNVVAETPAILGALNIAFVNNLLITLPISFKDYAQKTNLQPVSDVFNSEEFSTGIIYRKDTKNIDIIKNIIHILQELS